MTNASQSVPSDLAQVLAPNPRDLGLPHDTWRPAQYAAYQHALRVRDEEGNLFVEAPTGTGKTSIVAALGADRKTHALVHTLGLLDQYQKEYNFVGVKGRNSYPCVLDKKVEDWKAKGKTPTAADCHFSPMTKCPAKDECPYLIDRARMFAAKRSVTTYKYAALSAKMSELECDIVCDEAHAAAEEIIAFSSMTVSPKDIENFALPYYPFKTYGIDDKGAVLEPQDIAALDAWVSTAKDVVRAQLRDADDPESIWAAQLRAMKARLDTFEERLHTDQWFLVFEGWGKERQMHLKALSSRIAARRLLDKKGLKMFMSGTLGNPEPLARELGIAEGQYEYHVFPHPVPVDARPIHDLKMTSMSAYNIRSNPALYQIQARVIWNWVQTLDPRYRGLILTTSHTKIGELYKHIGKFAAESNRRVMAQGVGPNSSLAQTIDKFFNERREGDIAIGTIQGWGSGLDFRGDLARWVAVAGVPHVNPTDQYAKARRELAGGEKYQMWTTYMPIVQATGRVSRGEMLGDEYMTNYAALADGMTTTAKAMSYYSDYFKEAIR